MLRVLVCTIHPVASVAELAHDFWVQVHALIPVGAFRKELALLIGVVVRALSGFFVARWEVTAPDQLLLGWLLSTLCASLLLGVSFRLLARKHQGLCRLLRVGRYLVFGVDGAEALKSLLFKLLGLLLGKYGLFKIELLR